MIAAYLRVSCDTQDVARQRDSIAAWAAREGMAIDTWFEDTEAKSFLDSIEFYPVSGDATCFTVGAKQAPS